MSRIRRTVVAALAGSLLLGVVSVAPRVSAAEPAELDPVLVGRLAAAGPAEELIVFVHADDVGTSRTAALDAGLGVIETWDRIGVTVAAGTPGEIRSLADEPGLTYLEADRPITFFQETSHVATRADLVHGTTPPGLDGSGTSIAIVDSGIRGSHEAFGDRVPVNLKNVCASPACYSLLETQSDTRDELWVAEPVTNDTDTPSNGGHGTHVAGIAGAGFDNVTGGGGGETFTGSAPGATLIGLSVGQLISVYGGNSGLNWVLEHHENPCEVNGGTCPAIVAVNNSYGPLGGGEYDPESATAKLQHELVLEGVTVVWAAGNDGGNGNEDNTNPPGKSPIPGVISVANYDDGGAGTRDGALAGTSSRGLSGDPTTYPDISAPGTRILSTCGPALPICKGGDILDPEYGSITGTSMAAPHIAGYVALLKEADPALTPGEIEFILEETAYKFQAGGAYEPDPRHPGATTSFDKGHGLVDVAAAAAVARGEAVPVSEPPPPCPVGSTTFEDAEGDGSFGGQGLKSEPNVDIVQVTYTYVPAGEPPVATIEVVTSLVDLRGDTEPPTLVSDGEVFDLGFTVGDTTYYLRASRSVVRGKSYVLRQKGAAGAGAGDTTLASSVTGSFDGATDSVTMRLPVTTDALNLDGATLSGLTATAWTSEGVLLLRADEAAGGCPFVASAPTTTTDDGQDEPRGGGRPEPKEKKDKKAKEKGQDGGAEEQPPTGATVIRQDSGEVPQDSLMRTCGFDPVTQEELPGGPTVDPACLTYEITTTTADTFGFVIADLVPTSADGGDALRDYDVYVYDDQGNELGSSASVGAREHAFVQVPGEGTNTYTVLVQPYTAFAGDTFDLTISFGSLDDEPR